MLRVIGLLLLLACPAAGSGLPVAEPLRPSPNFTPAGPAAAQGVLVWLPGAYDHTLHPPPPEPEWVARMAARALDIWRFDRMRGQDQLASGGQALADGVRILRASGYRRVLLAGHSRGGWIALTAMARPGVADAIVALSPAAHGTQPHRRAEALAAWRSVWTAADAMGPGRGLPVVLVQLRDDPWDPDPPTRQTVAVIEAERAGIRLLTIHLPDSPDGHMGAYEPAFDARFGAEIAAFVDPSVPAP